MITSVFVALPSVAVMVALTVLLTAEATILNPPVLIPAGTVTVAGTLRAGLLLFSVTTVDLVAVAVRYAEQAFDCAPVRDCVPHEI